MIYFRVGSQAHRLVTLLSVAGEYPTRSIHILGNERVYKALVHKLISPETFYNPQTETEFTPTRLFTVTGKSGFKSLRLRKSAFPILEWICAKDYYIQAFPDKFQSDLAHIERNHRVAEALGMCLQAGFEFRPYCLPKLQNTGIKTIVPAEPTFYLGKLLKQADKTGNTEMNKTMFTRMAGALFAFGNCYAVYNTRRAAMKWNGMGEFKALHSLIEIGRMNAGISSVDSAILFGESDGAALSTLMDIEKNRRLEFRFDGIYRHIYFVPMDKHGIRQLSLFSVPDWKEKILALLFEPGVRAYNRGAFEYDACIDGVYILSHLDGDIARLARFQKGIGEKLRSCEVLCFPDQAEFVRKLISSSAGIKVIDRPLIEKGLNVKREVFT